MMTYDIPTGAGSRGAYLNPPECALLGTVNVTAATAPWIAATDRARIPKEAITSIPNGRRFSLIVGISTSRQSLAYLNLLLGLGRGSPYYMRDPTPSASSLDELTGMWDMLHSCFFKRLHCYIRMRIGYR